MNFLNQDVLRYLGKYFFSQNLILWIVIIFLNYYFPFLHAFLFSLHFILAECSTTESSDEIEKPELEEVSDEEETSFFDTREDFSEPSVSCGSITAVKDYINKGNPEIQLDMAEKTRDTENKFYESRYPHIERREKLPDPVEKEKGVSLWSMIKDNVGKDLTRVCLPVYFNEPISSLQKCFEDLEYSHLLDRAYEYGKEVYKYLSLILSYDIHVRALSFLVISPYYATYLSIIILFKTQALLQSLWGV